jgi:putative PIN family toxin of toxin-antitoxin system
LTRLIVLDTNILVSAGLTQGPPAHLVDLTLRRELSMILCPSVLQEYLEVMHRPKFDKAGFPPGWLDRLLALAARLPLDPPTWSLPLPDPKDATFLALAKTTGAVLVTGNLKHFPPEARQGVKVYSPQAFLAELASPG